MIVSAGGNDIGLVDILNDCIFGWKVVGYSSDRCDKTLAKTQSLIDNELPGSLDNLLTAAKAKLTPTTGRIYYTAYAQFVGSSSQCDSVYWNFWPLDQYAQALTTDRRNQMNTLATNVNKAIQAAVARAGSQVIYVDYVGSNPFALFPLSLCLGFKTLGVHGQSALRSTYHKGKTCLGSFAPFNALSMMG